MNMIWMKISIQSLNSNYFLQQYIKLVYHETYLSSF